MQKFAIRWYLRLTNVLLFSHVSCGISLKCSINRCKFRLDGWYWVRDNCRYMWSSAGDSRLNDPWRYLILTVDFPTELKLQHNQSFSRAKSYGAEETAPRKDFITLRNENEEIRFARSFGSRFSDNFHIQSWSRFVAVWVAGHERVKNVLRDWKINRMIWSRVIGS